MIIVTAHFYGFERTRIVGAFSSEEVALSYLRKSGVKPNRANECDYYIMETHEIDFPSSPTKETFVGKKGDTSLPKNAFVV